MDCASRDSGTHYQHQKFWIVDTNSVAWSTGNWDAADYPPGSPKFPIIPSLAWRKTNRDFTVFMSDAAMMAANFREAPTYCSCTLRLIPHMGIWGGYRGYYPR